jgi:hypothetical protein
VVSRAFAAIVVLIGVPIGMLGACGVRAPSPVDVPSLLSKRGPIEAHRDLEIRILANPRDIQAHLALAALDDRLGRPSEAIDELGAVEKQGGPIGVRWHAADRDRLARLLVARGQARATRGSPAALADLSRARELGATVAPDVLASARVAAALGKLRHVDAGLRAEGRTALAALASSPHADPSWRGAADDASAAAHGAFGAWLWTHGARREAYEQLAGWHAVTPPPRDETLQAAYLRAVAWWQPSWLGERPPPEPSERIGPERCRFGCEATSALGDPEAERALLGSPIGARTTDPAEAAALAAITLRGALRGDGPWWQLLASRVDLVKLDLHALPKPLRATFARLVGKREPPPKPDELDHATDDVRLVAAAERVIAGAEPSKIRAMLGGSADSPDARALLAIAEPAAPLGFADARARSIARYVTARTGVAADAAFVALARAYDRDPAIAERLGRDFVAQAVDGALAHAAVGAAFEALGSARVAREQWQAAFDGDRSFATGLAEAIARDGDGDAALVAMASAAAYSGDPAPVLTLIAHALVDARRPVDALVAARSAIDLAGPEALAPALDVAIVASRLVKRDAQADGLVVQRARLAPPLVLVALPFDDPTDAAAALDELVHTPNAAATAHAWVAAAWNPRDVELRAALLHALPADDPRRPTLYAELVELAGDPEPERALEAVRALR